MKKLLTFLMVFAFLIVFFCAAGQAIAKIDGEKIALAADFSANDSFLGHMAQVSPQCSEGNGELAPTPIAIDGFFAQAPPFRHGAQVIEMAKDQDGTYVLDVSKESNTTQIFYFTANITTPYPIIDLAVAREPVNITAAGQKLRMTTYQAYTPNHTGILTSMNDGTTAYYLRL